MFFPGRLRWQCLLGVVAAGLLVAESGCQSAEKESRKPTIGSQTMCQAPVPVAAAAPPDSLQPVALAPLPGLSAEVRQQVAELYQALGSEAQELRLPVLERACVGYLTLRHAGRIRRPAVLAVADMDLPSTKKRLWVLDLNKKRVLQHSYVAHGRGSGYVRARRFSNRIKSACTALGFYRTADTYDGKHGLSRRLHGLDPGQNSNALDRYVVLHGADYAGQAYLAKHQQLGYSRGCPALPPEQYRAVIKAVGEGACLFLSGPGLESKWLDGGVAAQQLAARGWQ
ncbi:murein L,D-transpeptidase catalytic domain family protein [Hymenobacter chitinivorans]|uniref:murein L,D-transpeptidase catalytic domain family protein n=1 Tax=Hymenobacter chitinivorans TaxID=89969 RepID=UPI0012FD69AC|nr:murein L,D-transpeptidase catalytic domain family protein [Hymenobacter chitinivorans]